MDKSSQPHFAVTSEAIVEIDETYVGGKPHKDNNHSDDDKDDNNNDNKPKRGRGTSKTPVIGVKERNTGKVHAVVANYNEEGKQLSGKQLFNVLKKVCKKNTTVMTDQFSSYNILDKENDCNFVRLKIDHTVAFSLGDGIHTNGIESFWAVLKRGVYGVEQHTKRQGNVRQGHFKGERRKRGIRGIHFIKTARRKRFYIVALILV